MKLPGISLTFGGILGIGALAALAALALYLYYKRQDILTAVNPLDQNNAAITVANKITSAATGEPNTFGGWIYDLTHPEVARAISGNPPVQN